MELVPTGIRIGTLLAALVAGAVACRAAAQPPVATGAVPAWRQASSIAVLPVRGEIDRVTTAALERRASEVAARGARAIVLELDTPGGDLAATLAICRWLKERCPVPAWAWVRPQAFSAGTIISLACRGIIVSPGAAFGDAAPISASPFTGLQPLPADERAKLEAPLLAEVTDSARRNGHDETLARAFVSMPEEAWLLERDDGTERIFVGRPEWREAFGTEPPDLRGAGGARAVAAGDAPLVPYADLSLRPDAQGAPGAGGGAPAFRARLAAGEGARWRLVTQVDGAQELLVLHEADAVGSGVALASVAGDGELRAWFGATSLERIDEHWGDALVRFLTSWPVRLSLVAVLVAGFLVEIAVPGLGWFGAASTVALALLLGGPALAGVADWWPLLLVALGAALVALEVFVIAGTGIAGFLGAACAVVGLVAGFVDAPLGTPEGQGDLAAAIVTVAGGSILAAGAAWLVIRAAPRSAAGRAAVLGATVGGTSAPDRPGHGRVAPGTAGTAITPLRPSGKVLVEGEVLEAIAVGGMVDAGRPVTVVRSAPYALEVEERTT